MSLLPRFAARIPWCRLLEEPALVLVTGLVALRRRIHLVSERMVGGSPRRGRAVGKRGRPFKMTAAKLRLAMAAVGQPQPQPQTQVRKLCEAPGVDLQTLCRHVSPKRG